MMEAICSPKRHVLRESHGVTSETAAFFILSGRSHLTLFCGFEWSRCSSTIIRNGCRVQRTRDRNGSTLPSCRDSISLICLLASLLLVPLSSASLQPIKPSFCYCGCHLDELPMETTMRCPLRLRKQRLRCCFVLARSYFVVRETQLNCYKCRNSVTSFLMDGMCF
jgi:hypothetical protein